MADASNYNLVHFFILTLPLMVITHFSHIFQGYPQMVIFMVLYISMKRIQYSRQAQVLECTPDWFHLVFILHHHHHLHLYILALYLLCFCWGLKLKHLLHLGLMFSQRNTGGENRRGHQIILSPYIYKYSSATNCNIIAHYLSLRLSDSSYC